MIEVKTTMLRAGSCKHPQRMTIKDGHWGAATYPALPMLITHPVEGPILFDTGYDPAFVAATNPFPERFYRWLTPVSLKEGEAAVDQCRALGVAPGDIRHIVLSHFHADHMAGIKAFPHARIHCAKAGFEAACKGGRTAQVRRGILGGLIPHDFAERATFFEEAARVSLPPDLLPFETGADLLGDGSLLAVELPGHCPGHWGLLVYDSRFGHHFMIADAAWSLDAVRRNVPPPSITSGFLGDTKRGRETLFQLHQLWERNPDIRLTPYHCPERSAEVDQG